MVILQEVKIMHRFFIAASNLSKGVAVIQGGDAEHIKVLRMRVGDHMVVSDGEGGEYQCRLTKIGDGFVEADVLSKSKSEAEPTVRATVYAAMPKGEKADYIVQKCAEAGASSIFFFFSERCVSRPDPKALGKKIARWSKIAEEAAKQSGRGVIPRVSFSGNLGDTLKLAYEAELSLFMYETGERVRLKDALTSAGEFASVSVVTGSEGGFEKFEADIAGHFGLKICSCGPRILRCETAPVAVLSAIMYHTDNM